MTVVTTTTLHPVTAELRPVVESLWQLYLHDLSEFRDSMPLADGRFKAGRLPSFLDQPDRSAYLVRVDGAPAGFVLLTHENDRQRSIGEFFVVRGVRHRGVGHEVATRVLRESPGPWIVAFQEENPKAARFWRRVATDVAGQGWSEERLPVPDKPWLPPDVWLSLLVP